MMERMWSLGSRVSARTFLVVGLAFFAAGCATTTADEGGVVAGELPETAADAPGNQWTEEAETQLALADLRGADAATPFYRSALESALQSVENAPENAKGYLLAGRAYIGLDDLAGADSMFTRAVELFPEYEPEVVARREQVWVEEFNQGAEALQTDSIEIAIEHFQRADRIYQGRPEARMNLGLAYSRADQADAAIEAYEGTLEILRGPQPEGLDEAGVEQWAQWEENIEGFLLQLYTNEGVDYFNEEQPERAAEYFREALELNPRSRDALNNLTQTLYLLTTNFEQQRQQASGAEATQIEGRLEELYTELLERSVEAAEYDPYNRNLLLIRYRALQGLSGLVEGEQAATYRQRANDVVQEYESLPFQVTDVALRRAEGGGLKLVGQFENLGGANAGQPITLRFTFLGAGGSTVTTEEASFQVPASGEIVQFEMPVDAGRAIAGWRYEVIE